MKYQFKIKYQFQEAFDILGFTATEKLDSYKVTIATMLFGNIIYKQRGEQAEVESTDGNTKN